MGGHHLPNGYDCPDASRHLLRFVFGCFGRFDFLDVVRDFGNLALEDFGIGSCQIGLEDHAEHGCAGGFILAQRAENLPWCNLRRTCDKRSHTNSIRL